ncbi:iron ABC transporter permease [Thermoflexus sp.]|uniref:ABC transporter permease n=1 Tax=Thermoflexus sp. TaxID=1969742 RepID=UPI001771E892|nr:iron ABC transporter permease [Thermoflexus sp.]
MSRRDLLLIPLLLFFAVFYLYPLVSILRLSLAPEGIIRWEVMAQTLRGAAFWRVLGFTVGQAALSTGVTLALGLPLTGLFARYPFPGRGWWQAMATVPFVLPTVVVAAAFTALLGPRGWVNQILMAALGLSEPPISFLNTLTAIVVAHVFYNLTLVLRIVGNAWAHLDPTLEMAARTLGADRWQTLRRVTLPLLMPAILAATALVFLFDFTSFGVVLLLGGPRYATLEVEIYRQAVGLFNLPVAATLALTQLGLTFGILAIYARLQARLTFPLEWRPAASTTRPPRGGLERVGVGLGLAVLFLWIGLPLLALVLRSLTPMTLRKPGEAAVYTGWITLGYYRELWINRRGSVTYIPPIEAVRNSLVFAVAVTVLSLLLGGLAAYGMAGRRRRWLDPLLMLPLSTSAVTLGFGFLVGFSRPPTFLEAWPGIVEALMALRTSPLLVVIAHTLIAYPFVVRILLPAMEGMNPRWREAAMTLGASPWRVWWYVEAPLLGRALLTAAIFAFCVSLGEFGATALIARPTMTTMPLAIARFLSQPGELNLGQAMAMSTLLLLLTFFGILLIERFRYRGIGTF